MNAPQAAHRPPSNGTPAPGLGVQQVRDLFGPNVRVMLDWDELVRLNAPVSCRVLTDVSALYTPWYVDAATGQEVPYDYTTDKPLRVREAVVRRSMLNPDRVLAIDELAAAQAAVPSAWAIPCYAVNDTDLLILDGNHRAAAAVLHQLPARVLAVVMHGPIDAAVLPDLAFWKASAALC